jgi:hypothetical protein
MIMEIRKIAAYGEAGGRGTGGRGGEEGGGGVRRVTLTELCGGQHPWGGSSRAAGFHGPSHPVSASHRSLAGAVDSSPSCPLPQDPYPLPSSPYCAQL